MRQKAHGAACGTYANVAENQFSIIRGNEHLKNYQSSPSVMRTSCAVCASPLLWVSKTEFPGIISFTLATLAPLFPSYISEIFTLRTKLLGLGIRLKNNNRGVQSSYSFMPTPFRATVLGSTLHQPKIAPLSARHNSHVRHR
ncbi:MAG: GFA family protein [Proteobacteria bacterium]|nr:GFA family protein [Pseudomonadota bacterium]